MDFRECLPVCACVCARVWACGWVFVSADLRHTQSIRYANRPGRQRTGAHNSVTVRVSTAHIRIRKTLCPPLACVRCCRGVSATTATRMHSINSARACMGATVQLHIHIWPLRVAMPDCSSVRKKYTVSSNAHPACVILNYSTANVVDIRPEQFGAKHDFVSGRIIVAIVLPNKCIEKKTIQIRREQISHG